LLNPVGCQTGKGHLKKNQKHEFDWDTIKEERADWLVFKDGRNSKKLGNAFCTAWKAPIAKDA
jgi:hypothetical protein